MLPCIAHIVAAGPDATKQGKSSRCQICKNRLTDPDHAVLPKTALCSGCYEQLTKSQPPFTQ
jgi:formylmethanofuran dehydrogenase subunit E